MSYPSTKQNYEFGLRTETLKLTKWLAAQGFGEFAQMIDDREHYPIKDPEPFTGIKQGRVNARFGAARLIELAGASRLARRIRELEHLGLKRG